VYDAHFGRSRQSVRNGHIFIVELAYVFQITTAWNTRLRVVASARYELSKSNTQPSRTCSFLSLKCCWLHTAAVQKRKMASGTRVVGTHVRLDGTYPVSHTSTMVFHLRFTSRSSGQIYGQDNFAGKGFLEALKQRLSVNIISETEESIEFDLVGIEAPLANALRRILLAEVRFVWTQCDHNAGNV